MGVRPSLDGHVVVAEKGLEEVACCVVWKVGTRKLGRVTIGDDVEGAASARPRARARLGVSILESEGGRRRQLGQLRDVPGDDDGVDAALLDGFEKDEIRESFG